jgi:hypothetical protein
LLQNQILAIEETYILKAEGHMKLIAQKDLTIEALKMCEAENLLIKEKLAKHDHVMTLNADMGAIIKKLR